MLETVRDIKACNQKERYLHGLKEKLIKTEKAEIKTELVTGVFVTSAAAFLRLGLAILEDESHLELITGCMTHHSVNTGLHLAVEEHFSKLFGRVS